MGHIVNNIFRFLFAWIDSLVIRLITMMYKLFTNMTDLVIYSDNIIKTIGRRIGLILGIFMLFKLAISLINYMISPDKISDKSQGGGKLIVNVIISLALLISVNFIFKEAYMLQSKVVNSHIIEKIFFGDYGIVKSTNDNESGTIKMDIGYYLYSGFFPPNEKVFKDVCDDMWDVSTDITIAQEGQRSCNDLLGEYLSDDERSNIYRARNTLDLSYVYSDWDTVNARYGNNYVFDYMSIISTAAGVICLIIMISFSMSLATRAIKLFFLQIVAPIPIISNMDLGKGQDIFKKWVKQCVNTYLTVFIRIIALDFAVFMIVLLRGNYKNVFTNNVWLNIFLIIGCLFFAKEVPKLLEDLFGIKMDGMTLHPLKNFQENALFGKNITGLAGAGLAGAAAFGANTLATEGNIFKRLGSGFAGATSASLRGAVGALKGQKFGDVYKGAYNNSMIARVNRDDRNDLGIKPWEVWGERIRSSMHIPNSSQKDDSRLKHLDDFSAAGTAAKQRAEGEIDKKADAIKYNGTSLGALRDYYEQLKNSGGPSRNDSVEAIRNDIKSRISREKGQSESDYENKINSILSSNQSLIDDHFKKAQMAHAEATSKAHSEYFKARKAITNEYIKNSANLMGSDGSGNFVLNAGTPNEVRIEGFQSAFGTQDAAGNWSGSDTIVTSNIEKMTNINAAHDTGVSININDIGKTIQAADDARSSIRGSASYEKAQLIQQQAQKEKK